MAKAKQNNTIIYTGIAAALGILFLRKKNPTATGIGTATQVLHWLQAVNNDYLRIKKEKWSKKEIRSYCDDVGRRYVTPICFFNEPTLKGSTDGSGDIKHNSSILKTFLDYNFPLMLKEDDKSEMFSRMNVYDVFAILYSEKLEEFFGID